ncbi:hypothetical protein HN018_22855 (plasmid) [Lichenicola cladoniae]|uniref:Uncharacterized protein n=1 Tax=Lichenicola cladoniae TaxID=1484109 RepID=A0A6M8HXC8_9PROT|nr:GMC family oxidoreductase [Lichenicola cladoniae]NPD68660.1 hypothetical protein [Acetobacteraceae bacterium]QKE93042.1 hypothetical protein HN018_22855 [Lichenicola cladoniae]
MVAMNPTELRTLSALFDCMFPASASVPGASAIGADAYLAGVLAGPYAADLETYRAVCHGLDRASGGSFAQADAGTQHSAITALENGTLRDLREERPGITFDLVLRHLREGLFGDPVHGGNRAMMGWHAVGFPGVEPGFTAEQQRLDYVHPPAARSLRDLPTDTLRKAPAVEVAGGPAPTQEGPTQDGQPRREQPSGEQPWGEADVVIVGGGAVGGFLARKLVMGGLRVVMLEAGATRTGREHRMDELSATAFRNEGGGAKFNREIPTWRRNDGEQATRAIRSQGLETALGGNSVAWGAVAMRFYEDDFRVRSATAARYGADRIPPNSSLADWPLSYDDLAPFYDEAEDLLGVSGQAWTSTGGNPFEAPRHHGYAMPPLRTSGLGELFADAARTCGYHPFPLPAAILTEPFRGRAACTYCSFCSRFGCHVDAKASAQNTVLPEAMNSGLLRIVSGARVLRVLTDGSGRATGVLYRQPDGEERIQLGGTIVLATYTFENVRLLLRSTDSGHARGLGNETGQVGLHYITRQQPAVYGVFGGRRLNRFTGPTAQAQAIADFSADFFDHSDLGFIRGGRIAAFNQYLPTEASAVLPPDVPRWGAAWRDFFVHAFSRTAMLFIDPEILPYASNRLDLDPEYKDDLGQPVTRITFDIHQNERRLTDFLQDKADNLLQRMGATRIWRRPPLTGPISTHDVGGTRMGHDAQSSVIDGFGRVHDTPGLVVLGGSTFVSLPAVNPFLSILALALRAGDKILQDAAR